MTASAYRKTSALDEIVSTTDAGPFRRNGQTLQTTDDNHELALMHRIKTGDFDARQQLVAGNLLHVLRSNKRYAHGGAGIFDLLSAGDKGLVHALENFEPENKGRFSAYAAACIRQHIEHALGLQHIPSARTALPHGGSSGSRPQCV